MQRLKTQEKSSKVDVFLVKILKTQKKTHRKLISFQHLLGMNFEDEGANKMSYQVKFTSCNISKINICLCKSELSIE